MARQERVSKRPAKADERPVSYDGQGTQAGSGSGHSPDPTVLSDADEFLSELDELFDEIDDEWTEEAAEELVRDFVQRGGE